MGKTLIVYKLYPDGPENVDVVEKAVREVKSGELKEVRREPIAFGMSLLRAAFLLPEKDDDASGKLEAELKALPGLNEVEVEMMTLL
ncbi:MAG: hypothetical protein V1847_03465 [Candidatus Diapherotrites archaeon]